MSPLSFVRRPHQHRYQAYAPKLSRCIILSSWSAVQLWAMLEAHPAVTQYCERPATTMIDGRERLVDFWVRHGKLEKWFLISADGEDAIDLEFSGVQGITVDQHRIETISSASFADHTIWIDNWLSILPYLANGSRLVEASFIGQIVKQCREPMSLSSIEHANMRHDPMLVRTAVFSALHRGELIGVDLRGRHWNLDSQFVQLEHGLHYAA